MLKKMLGVAVGGLAAVLIGFGLAQAGPSAPASFNGNYLVQASGTVYYPYIGDAPQGVSANTQQAQHFSMAGSASFMNGNNTAVNLTLNLGGASVYEGTSSFWSQSGNDVICYLTTPGDLVYTPGSGTTPAMLTVTSVGGNDTCGQPSGEGVNSEVGKVIPFNFYPYSLPTTGGLIVSNYTHITTGGGSLPPGSYPNAFIDSYGNPAYDYSVTGQLTPALP
ncbi:MAG TPA: hypothetical protein VMU41_11810 [Candidatus Binataceae bacterium]|nr:hypothetical protein [Candidatus Binataceae bacterium]